MDRKAWIVVTLCAIGIALNIWMQIKYPSSPKAAPKDIPASTQQTAGTPPAATPPPASPTAAPAPAPGATPAAPAAGAQTYPERTFTFTSGSGAEAVTFHLTSQGGGIAKAETHKADGSVDVALNDHGKAPICSFSIGAMTYNDIPYRVAEESPTRVVFEAETPAKLLIRKEYSLREGGDSHLLTFKLTLTNQATGAFTHDDCFLYTGAAAELRPGEIVAPSYVWNNGGDAEQKDAHFFHEESGWFGGPVVEYHANLDRLRWAGVMSRFYTTLIATKEDQPGKIWCEHFLLNHANDEFKDDSKAAHDYAIHGGMGLPPVNLSSGASKSYEFQMYLGPKVYRTLASLDRQQEFVMFYGWFSLFSRAFVYMMRLFHDWFNNWGCAILLLTFCIRMCLWPIQARSNSTMKRMGLLQKPMKELQEKYKNEPQRLNTEVMKLYKEYGVNPVSGCIPMFLQLPIFFGFYRMLQNAAELRGQSFLWVKDLSLPDTVGHLPGLGYAVNVLPLLMGITMILQFKLTPQPPSADKTQARMMMFMPLIFLYVSYNFASALALYWTAQNIISIAQAQIQRRFSKDPVLGPPVSASGGGGSGGAADKKKKDKPSPPRLGGGSTKSRK